MNHVELSATALKVQGKQFISASIFVNSKAILVENVADVFEQG
jgi:hypothetical protein